MAGIGNTVQCGVYMLNAGGLLYAIPCSGVYSDLGVPNDVDDYYLVYPGFKVKVQANSSYYACDNTTGTSIVKFPATANQASNFKVYYMNYEIAPPTVLTIQPITSTEYSANP